MFEKVSEWLKKAKSFLEEKNIGKDKLILLAFGAGLFLVGIIFSGGDDKEEKKTDLNDKKETENVISEEVYIEEMEDKLRDLLCEVQGVGSVDVFISYEGSYEKIVLIEEDLKKDETRENDSEGGVRVITSEDTDRNVVYDKEDEPYLIRTKVPKITGVAVVAEGGNDPLIIQKINSIIKALFAIEVNKIAVVGK